MPVVMILTMLYLHTVDPRLEEAGRLISGWPAVLRCITGPMILPGILFAGVLVFLLALGEVGVPMLLRYPVFPTQVLTQFSAFYDFGAAVAAATPLLGVTLLVVALERYYLREKTYQLRPTTPGTQMLRIALGRWRTPALLAVSWVAALTTVLPLLALLLSSVASLAQPEPLFEAAGSLWRSLVLGAVGATLLTLLGFFCGYLIHHRAIRLWRAVDTLTLLLFTIPGTVIGMGLIALWNRPASAFLYASPAIVILAYLAQYTALTSRITLATLANVPRSLEEAAQTGGVPWFSRIVHVLLPCALPGVIAAWLIGFIFCLRDLGASMLVYPAGLDTLPVRIFTLMANGAPSLISALCLILVAVTSVALAILGLWLRVVGGRW
jgi:iron(III) transport system permease protein